ncbi:MULTISPECIES: hypothetical protein [Vibrio harveyi group]|uniref:hypothetical protein n=1 Tax=Vibrio harveyi group TaxID=717610 RepID=UPI000A39C55B|nr:hypothetical protein [Vibrio parahaemolyticus]EJE4179172.1 hypothetical protein [Vibrio parahaemolyticus]MBY7720080.1 hypothetical protein [Vibrio parahaemolyticus]MCZ6289654.1 hypothetical protein [Vibrio parahaemolyticus]MCZ6376987.1 hypothetical protein [Vibrio parahaemolyticus]MDF4661945.1 hypothetical protein [Vibrio parahaemolyticus]
MSKIRISKQQKKSLLLIHFLELRFGKHLPVNTSFLRAKVEAELNEESRVEVKLAKNHFLVSLRTLAKHGYLVYQPNVGKQINDNVRETESMWQLTDDGRQFTETYHSALIRPKRSYVKS